jgi:FkbM family methyltransferase
MSAKTLSNGWQRLLWVKRHCALRVAYVIRYISVYGVLGAVRMWCRLRSPIGSGSACVEIVPGEGCPPLWLRKRAPDIGTFESIYVWKGYGFELPFAPERILDLGGNVGLASRWFAARYPNARICAVEPEAGNYALLERNCRCESRILTLRAAVGPRYAQARLENPDGASHAWRYVERSDGDVRVMPVAGIVAAISLGFPDLVKIDIEGAEEGLFSDELSLQEWLPGAKAIAIEIHSLAARKAIERALGPTEWLHHIHGETDLFVRRGAGGADSCLPT